MKETFTCIDCISNKRMQIIWDAESLLSRNYIDDNSETNIYAGPGLVDLQINGFVGIDFNTFPIEEAGFLTLIEALLREGISSFFPTIITNSPDNIISLLNNLYELCQRNPLIADVVEGIHLEGPFISPHDEARGAHDSRYIRAPDWELFQAFRKASNDRIKIVTLSAEWDHAAIFTKKCVEENIIVAIGHTMASPEQIKAVTDAGARLSTHLGNGAPLMLARNSNMIFEQLARDELACSLIADGSHLSDSFLKVAIKSKQDRAILVSDSTMFAGMKPGSYDSHIGGKVVLDNNKRLSLFNNRKLLAGSAVSLLDCVEHLIKRGIADLSQAWSMASILPGKLIGNKNKALNTLENPDLVLFTYEKGRISILSVIKNGKIRYRRHPST